MFFSSANYLFASGQVRLPGAIQDAFYGRAAIVKAAKKRWIKVRKQAKRVAG